MKFFFPDSHDLVDPSYNFIREDREYAGSRQQAQQYAHEALGFCPYNGMLLSKAVVDGHSKSLRYSFAQIQRLKRQGVRDFLRLGNAISATPVETMGDCGSFTYVNEPEPPFSVQSVCDFYTECRFDYGMSLDHVVLGFSEKLCAARAERAEWKRRCELTLTLAEDFLKLHSSESPSFTPIGVAQGWNTESYANSVMALQKMGYSYIALGGMVSLKTREILACLDAVASVRKPSTKLHLLGIGRFDNVAQLESLGVASFDSTGPLKQAFMDDKDNYHTLGDAYTAIRIPQVGENAKLKKKILAGTVDHGRAVELERKALKAARAFDSGSVTVDDFLDILSQYAELWGGEPKILDRYRRTLEAAPWRNCTCTICRTIGIHVILFRGAERNRRRGFHNLHVTHHRLNQNPA